MRGRDGTAELRQRLAEMMGAMKDPVLCLAPARMISSITQRLLSAHVSYTLKSASIGDDDRSF